MMLRYGIRALLALVMALALTMPVPAGMKHGEMGMKMHHLHILMNHGIGMVVEGANLKMVGQMGMSPALDADTIKHGENMIEMGREVVKHALNGPEMMAMMKGKDAESPSMKYTHKLGEAMFEVIAQVQQMGKAGSEDGGMMDMHHMHIMLLHALQMAAEGSNMIMLGNMGMAGEIDDYSVQHGEAMLDTAKATVDDVMSGQAMMDMMGKGGKGMDDPMMKGTHELAESVLKTIDLLEKMPSGK
jgi:hypothetical protein